VTAQPVSASAARPAAAAAGPAQGVPDAIATAADTGELPAGGPAALRRLPFDARLEVFADIAPSLTGEPRAALTRAARDTGLIAGAERRCASRRWPRRLRAVRLLTALGGGERTAPALLRDPRIEVRTQAAEWAVEHPTPDNVAALVAMLGDEALLARFTVQDALTRIGRTATPAVAAAIRGADGEALLGEPFTFTADNIGDFDF
jgi:hypothetical protein